MNENKFIHLHLHDHGSLKDACGTPKQFIKRAKELGHDSFAVTNHGNMVSVYELYELAYKDNDLKVLYGCEFYLVADLTDKQPAHRGTKYKERRYHVNLIAKNFEGWRNLLKLCSIANTDGQYMYYGKLYGRIDWKTLMQYKTGLICLSACANGEIAQAILKETDVDTEVIKYQEAFGEDFYLEIMPNEMEEQQKVNLAFQKISKEYNIKCVATNDIHYIYKEDVELQDMVLMLSDAKTISSKNIWRFTTRELYFKTYDEMLDSFKRFGKDLDEKFVLKALANTLEVRDKCDRINIKPEKLILPDIDLTGKQHYDRFLAKKGKSIDDFLLYVCVIRLKQLNLHTNSVYTSRLKYEIDIIKRFNYTRYFFIVQDIIQYAKDNNIFVGAARGSAAGCLVSYLLGITQLDPIIHDLYFERFLNVERIKPPDIDVDFEDIKRDQVKNYIRDRFGAENTAEIIAYSTYSLNTAIRDILRIQEVPFNDVNMIAKKLDENLSLEDNLRKENIPALFYIKYKKEIDLANKLVDQIRHETKHAAGVTVTDMAINNYVPVKIKNGVVVTQWDGIAITSLNLLKLDILGLNTLRIFSEALRMIKERHDVDIDLNKLRLDDKKVYEMFSNAYTQAIFQFSSYGMREILKKIKPDKFDDLVTINALYRPATILSGLMNDYIKNRYNPKGIRYLHEDLKKIFGDTFGICVFQEQMMRLISHYSGMTLGEADIVRRLIEGGGAVRTLDLEEYKQKFLKGAREKFGEKTATNIWDYIASFQIYGFNKSHSAGYAFIGYQAMWLKCYYPLEFMNAVLKATINNEDEIVASIKECNKMNIEILPVDINKSEQNFIIEDKAIRMGLLALKNVGEASTQEIITNRPFNSFKDFLSKINRRKANKRVQAALIKVKAFDSIDDSNKLINEICEVEIKDINETLLNKWHKELAGFNLRSGTSLENQYTKYFKAGKIIMLERIKSGEVGRGYIIAKVTKNDKVKSAKTTYHRVTLEDDSDTFSINYFEEQLASKFEIGNVILASIIRNHKGFYNFDHLKVKVLK